RVGVADSQLDGLYDVIVEPRFEAHDLLTQLLVPEHDAPHAVVERHPDDVRRLVDESLSIGGFDQLLALREPRGLCPREHAKELSPLEIGVEHLVLDDKPVAAGGAGKAHERSGQELNPEVGKALYVRALDDQDVLLGAAVGTVHTPRARRRQEPILTLAARRQEEAAADLRMPRRRHPPRASVLAAPTSSSTCPSPCCRRAS